MLDKLLDILATSIGSLTNPTNIANVFNSNGYPFVDNNGNENVNNRIISSYLDYLIDVFLIEKADRYDIKGKKIIIVRDDINAWQNEDGIVIMNVIDFLLDKNSLDA